MAKGIAICIGLNSVDSAHYQGWSGELIACEADAQDMTAIGKSKGMATTQLLTKQATRKSVITALENAASTLAVGDFLMLTYSGHGGQLPDKDGDEDDGLDETWCLYDGELLDDELYVLYSKFAKGVRILVLSDSCHSGTVARNLQVVALGKVRSAGDIPRYRNMPPEIAQRTYRANQPYYDEIALAATAARKKNSTCAAAVLLISGCQDNQLSQDGTFNGLFTAQVLKVWNGGKFKKSYRRFHASVLALMPPDQSPNYFTVGAVDKIFEAQRPFMI